MADAGPAIPAHFAFLLTRQDIPRASLRAIPLSSLFITVDGGAAPKDGLTQFAKIQCLQDQITGTMYVMLFTDLPDSAGLGGIELTAPWYSRIAHSAWVTEAAQNIVKRLNIGQVDFLEVTEAATIVGWGIITSLGGGDLIGFGRLRDTNSNPITVNLLSGDQPRFLDRQLKVGIQ